MHNNLIENILNNLGELSADVKARLRSQLQQALVDQGLISSEAFETQKQVLLRTRQKLSALEKRLAELEISVK